MAKPAVRLRVVEHGVFVALALLAVRAAQVQLLEGRRWAEEAQAQRTERIVLQARRGTLSDRHGTPLALTQETYHVGVAPNELRDPVKDGAVIARQLGLSARAWQQALRRRYAYFAGPFSALEVQPLRSTRGVHLEAVVNRFYPAPQLARATIRSEEHTSELQSRLHLVCRLLLEKKKQPSSHHKISTRNLCTSETLPITNTLKNASHITAKSPRAHYSDRTTTFQRE